MKRAPRARLLSEAADHLRSSADEIAASGIAADVAEEEAVARFGAAALVARRFAHAVASTSARTALLWAVTACACYAAAAAFFIVSGPVWLRDFPQGAPSIARASSRVRLARPHRRARGALPEDAVDRRASPPVGRQRDRDRDVGCCARGRRRAAAGVDAAGGGSVGRCRGRDRDLRGCQWGCSRRDVRRCRRGRTSVGARRHPAAERRRAAGL